MLEGLKRKHCLCLKLPYDAIIHHTINLQPYDKSKPLHFLMTADHQSCQVVELEVKAAFFYDLLPWCQVMLYNHVKSIDRQPL